MTTPAAGMPTTRRRDVTPADPDPGLVGATATTSANPAWARGR